MHFKTLVICTAVLSVLVPAAFATPIAIAPGSTVSTFTPTASSFVGTEVATYSTTFSNAYENGAVYEDVYNNGGVLDFYYQIVNNLGSEDALSRMTVGIYTGYTTAVDYLLNTNVAPTSATRQVAGSSVGFFFTLAPGQMTDWMEVATNATAYVPGSIALIDSLTTNLTGYGPAAIPEPLSLGLLGAGLLVIGVARARAIRKTRIGL